MERVIPVNPAPDRQPVYNLDGMSAHHALVALAFDYVSIFDPSTSNPAHFAPVRLRRRVHELKAKAVSSAHRADGGPPEEDLDTTVRAARALPPVLLPLFPPIELRPPSRTSSPVAQ
ncbi:hypothetical protein AURDEDRAFT_172863 [Auricularia subglabra TFB-10046 SS5]|uniref:Uncharacterized protein n=1 Tax=Auricularia subglabra (strain TFB-10046 / SS5) TaxID=717982 RepID=J0LIF5_AURST|nr:hypothetical protein AURDEDRAFT_172863 [Auricularia subglabra TFB-10046 SS5]